MVCVHVSGDRTQPWLGVIPQTPSLYALFWFGFEAESLTSINLAHTDLAANGPSLQIFLFLPLAQDL